MIQRPGVEVAGPSYIPPSCCVHIIWQVEPVTVVVVAMTCSSVRRSQASSWVVGASCLVGPCLGRFDSQSQRLGMELEELGMLGMELGPML